MRYLAMIAALAMMPATMPAAAQTKAPATPTVPAGTCASLMKAYNTASMDMASNWASAVADNSAPRATLRAMEDANSLATAKIALDLMRDNRCALPKNAPSMAPYISSALTCRTDQMKNAGSDSPESCKRESWIASQ